MHFIHQSGMKVSLFSWCFLANGSLFHYTSCAVEIIHHNSDASPLSFTGARLTRPLLHMYRGQLTRGSRPERGARSECHVRAAPDSPAQHVHFGGAGEGTAEENQLLGAHADEQF